MTAHLNLKHSVKGKACQRGPKTEKKDYVPNREPAPWAAKGNNLQG